MSLVSGWFPPVVALLAIASLLGSLARQREPLRRQLFVGFPVAGGIVGLIAAVDDGFALVPWQFPNSYYLYAGLVILAVCWFVVGLVPRSWPRHVTGFFACILTTLLMVTLINQHYGYYPTLDSLLGKNAEHQVSNTELRDAQREYLRTHRLPDHGFTISVPIPGTVSGFAARPAEIWLPPSWVADPTPTLPVLELITGAPGAPADWTREAYADQTARLFAQDHGGTAPLIVMPDPNGSEFNDTECVDSPRGRSETYLTVDVLAFVAKEFQAKVTARSVALVGLSAGGSCAVMLALRHPDLYTAFADFSGLTGPTVGESVDPTATTQTLFDGSREAYDAHDPLHLLRVAQYPTLAAWFDVGSSDPEPLAAQRELVPLALAAGITTCAHEEPGGHDGDFWTGAFRRALPWLSGRLGVTPPIGCG